MESGTQFGRLTVVTLKRGPARAGRRKFGAVCLCVCGVRKWVDKNALLSGRTRSCGCLHKERLLETHCTHNNSGSPEYIAWRNAKSRCGNPSDPRFSTYGARGIRVCGEWALDFGAFLRAVGKRPSPKHTLDRIDNDKGYELGNVRWVSRVIQARNRTTSRFVLCRGKRLSLAEWGERSGRRSSTIHARLTRGLSAEMAIFGPMRDHFSRS